MKQFKLYTKVLTVLSLVILASCGKEDETPTFPVGFQFSPAEPVAGQTVTFTNASQGGTTWEWNFDDGTKATTKDASHVFKAAGTYVVTLTADGNPNLVGERTVTVGAALPQISYTPTTVAIGVDVTFSATIFNPNNLNVSYQWTFPVGTTGTNAEGKVNGQQVTVRFNEVNATTPVSVNANIGGLSQATGTINVDVKDQLAKTLYIAEKNGNIWFKKIYPQGEAELTDTGVEAGAHAMTLSFVNDRLYAFNAGERITFAAVEYVESQVGSIFSVGPAFDDYKTHLTFTTNAMDDAFFGSVNAEFIYFTDRRNDVTRIPVTTENGTWDVAGLPVADQNDVNPDNYPHLVANNELAYYSTNRQAIDGGNSYPFGALNGTFVERNGTFWWAKNSTGRGIWRFSSEDIGAVAALPTEGEILFSYGVRAFKIDEVNEKIYFSSNAGLKVGFFRCNLDGSNIEEIDLSGADSEGGANEATFITGIDIDHESGYVYWAYRGPSGADVVANPLLKSGIKRWKLDGTGDVEYFIEGVQAYGLAIDQTIR